MCPVGLRKRMPHLSLTGWLPTIGTDRETRQHITRCKTFAHQRLSSPESRLRRQISFSRSHSLIRYCPKRLPTQAIGSAQCLGSAGSISAKSEVTYPVTFWPPIQLTHRLLLTSQAEGVPKAETWRLFGVRLSVEDDPGKDNHDSSLALCQAVAFKLKCKVGYLWRLALQHCLAVTPRVAAHQIIQTCAV